MSVKPAQEREKGVTRESLRERWQAKANEIGLDCTEIRRIACL